MNRIYPDYVRVEALAYSLWQQRGSPIGSALDDWCQAEQMLGITPSMTVSLPLFSVPLGRWTG
jgi:hypothetical protein